MGAPIANMRSNPYALCVAYGVIGLSLWMLNRDTIANLSSQFLASVIGTAAETRADSPSLLGEHARQITNRQWPRNEGTLSRADAMSLLLQWIFVEDDVMAEVSRGIGSDKIEREEVRDLRRRVAVALLVYAAIENSRARGG